MEVWVGTLDSTSLKIWLKIDEITNSHAELYSGLKKLDRNKINLRLCKYFKRNNNFRIALQRHFINKLTKNAYIKGSTKRQRTTIKQAFIKNYDDPHDNCNSVPSPEIEVKTWAPKKKLKTKKITVFISTSNFNKLFKKPSPNTCLQK